MGEDVAHVTRCPRSLPPRPRSPGGVASRSRWASSPTWASTCAAARSSSSRPTTPGRPRPPRPTSTRPSRCCAAAWTPSASPSRPWSRQGENRILVELPGVTNDEEAQAAEERIGQTAQLSVHPVSSADAPTERRRQAQQKGNEVLPAEDGQFLEIAHRASRATRSPAPRRSSAENSVGYAVARRLQRLRLGRLRRAHRRGGLRAGRPAPDRDRAGRGGHLQPRGAGARCGGNITGSTDITGDFTLKTASDLSPSSRAARCPCELELISDRLVGPTLGEEAIDASLEAGVIGLILTGLFIIVVYRLVGAMATIALASYALLAYAMLLALGSTLTLPGLAGFVLAIGMAIDANVLVFERAREEYAAYPSAGPPARARGGLQQGVERHPRLQRDHPAGGGAAVLPRLRADQGLRCHPVHRCHRLDDLRPGHRPGAVRAGGVDQGRRAPSRDQRPGQHRQGPHVAGPQEPRPDEQAQDVARHLGCRPGARRLRHRHPGPQPGRRVHRRSPARLLGEQGRERRRRPGRDRRRRLPRGRRAGRRHRRLHRPHRRPSATTRSRRSRTPWSRSAATVTKEDDQTIGASLGTELRDKALIAFGVALAAHESRDRRRAASPRACLRYP